MPKNTRLVYSTESGRVKDTPDTDIQPTSDGVVRIHRESKGRGGKVVSLVKGVPVPPGELKKLAKTLKQLCGTGGAVKDGVIEIQGDHREKIKMALETQFTVKLAGS